MKPRTYGLSQTAQRLGYSREHVRRLVEKGELSCTFDEGGRRRFQVAEVEAFAAKRAAQKAAGDVRFGGRRLGPDGWVPVPQGPPPVEQEPEEVQNELARAAVT